MSKLTRDEILAMTAGPGMDAIVQRRVLRRPLLEWHGRQGWVSTPTARNIPAYSTDIAAAWEVVEHLRAKWRADCLRPFVYWRFWEFTDLCGDGWRASVRADEYTEEDVAATTLPLAVCLVALLLTLTEAA